MSILKSMLEGAKVALAEALKSYAVPVGVALVDIGLQAMRAEIADREAQLAELDEKISAAKLELGQHMGAEMFDVNAARTAHDPHAGTPEGELATATMARMPYLIKVGKGTPAAAVGVPGRLPFKFLDDAAEAQELCPSTGSWWVEGEYATKADDAPPRKFRADPVDELDELDVGVLTPDDEFESASVALDAQQAAEDYNVPPTFRG